MIALIDNYDSFTFNLYHYIAKREKVKVIKNDQIFQNINLIINSKAIVISPGPSNPFNAGECLELVNKIYSFIPILGVCLGHQILGVYFGSKLNTLKKPYHGKISNIKSDNKCKLFKNIPSNFKATRYHSLYLEQKNFPSNLIVTGKSAEDNIIMSFRHELYSIYGIQYHPESIDTQYGENIINNFINLI